MSNAYKMAENLAIASANIRIAYINQGITDPDELKKLSDEVVNQSFIDHRNKTIFQKPLFDPEKQDK